jgi:chemotaxis protein methyltransferase CheR
MLSDVQFDRIRRLALRLAGIELFERHRELLCRRWSRSQLRSPASFETLLTAAEAGDLAASRQFVALVTTKFTAFFRHPWHFDLAAEHALWIAHRRGPVRFWSAAAATGEEPFSLALALIEVFRRDDPPVSVLATDIDADALATATQAQYHASALRALDPARRARFFTETAPGRWQLVSAVRRLVQFRSLDLAGPDWPAQPPFDVIFCRNVLMYLEPSRRTSVLQRLASCLAPDGLLLLDPTEYPARAASLFEPGVNGLFVRRRASHASGDLAQRPPQSRTSFTL